MGENDHRKLQATERAWVTEQSRLEMRMATRKLRLPDWLARRFTRADAPRTCPDWLRLVNGARARTLGRRGTLQRHGPRGFCCNFPREGVPFTPQPRLFLQAWDFIFKTDLIFKAPHRDRQVRI